MFLGKETLRRDQIVMEWRAGNVHSRMLGFEMVFPGDVTVSSPRTRWCGKRQVITWQANTKLPGKGQGMIFGFWMQSQRCKNIFFAMFLA